MPTQKTTFSPPKQAGSQLTAHWSQPSFTFSAKERDVETGLRVTSLRSVSSLRLGKVRTSSLCTRSLRRFGSRYYSSDLSIWLSVDPMAAKYPGLSPFTYCADNPIKLVDPNGEELTEWDLDRKGNLTKRENGRTDIDIVHATNKNGKSVSRSYKANSINQKSQSFPGVLYKGTHEEIKYTSDYMTFSDIDVATDFFDFYYDFFQILSRANFFQNIFERIFIVPK